MIYLGGWSRAKERRIQIYSPSLPPSPPRATSFTPPPPLAASLLLALGFIDPLYIYLLCRGPLCHGSKGSRTGCTCRPLPHPLLTTPAIFGQYYKNQPTDFLRKILPPCSPEYFIAVHPSPPSSSSLPPPRFQGGKGRRAKSGGRRSVEGAARDSVLLRRALLLLLVSPRFGISSEGRRKGEAGEHRCGQKITRSFFVSSSGEARYNCGDCFFDSTMESMESLFDRRERIEGGKIPSDLPRSITARVLGSNRTRERGWTTTGAATNLTEL